MKNNNFFLTYLILAVAQIIVCNYLNLSYYVTLSILPLLILFIPVKFGTVFAMLLAFATGFAVDFLSEGVLGLNALALVPVAFVRKTVILLFFGNEVFARKDSISIEKYGFPKMALAIVSVEALFLAIYIWADGAGVRPFWFCISKFVLSLAAGWAVSILCSKLLTSERRSGWR